MRVILTVCIFFLYACGGAGVHTAPKTSHVPPPPKYDASTFFETTSLGGASISSDDAKILFSSDESGVFNVWSVSTQGGAAVQLTQSKTDARFAVAYFPNDDRFLYRGDTGGNEQTHLFVRELDGADKDLTPGEKVKAQFGGFSRDRKAFYVWTNERNPKFFDAYRYQVEGYSRELIFKNDAGWSPSAIDPSGRYIALGRVKNNADSDVYLVDLSTPDQAPVHITPHTDPANHAGIQFTPDLKSLLYTTDAHGEFDQVWQYDLSAGTHKMLVKRDWNVDWAVYSETGKYMMVKINEDASTRLEMWDRTKNVQIPLPSLPEGEVKSLTVSRDESRLALYVSSDREPANLFTSVIGDEKVTKLTDARNPKIDPQHLVDAQVIRYASFDKLKIPAILYRPHGASSSAKAPGIIFVHGGPGGQSRRGYRPMLQHLINHGYAILAVNNRGSSGYGKTFFHLDDKKHGDVDLKDCIWGRKYLESLDWIDDQRIAIMGGSYGGYMVAAALAFEPTSFELGINIFGVTNWVRTLESIPPWWASFREYLYAELGNPETDKERLRSISPLFHAHNIQKPLLVVQGANDPRVLKVESDEIVAAVKKNGVPVEYLVFDDEGHGFRKKVNRIAASQAYLNFLNTYLLKSTAVSE